MSDFLESMLIKIENKVQIVRKNSEKDPLNTTLERLVIKASQAMHEAVEFSKTLN